MLKILMFLSCFFSFMTFAEEYNLLPLGVESVTNAQCSVTAINDKGQVLGSYEEPNPNKSKIYIYDSKNGLTLIGAQDQWIYPITINNAGQVLGYGSKPFLWSKVLGIRYLDIPNSQSISANDLNDLGQIIGNYTPVGLTEQRAFLWDYGVVTEMGPGSEFSQQIETLGSHVMDIQLMSINNKGELAGYFAYGKYNEKKKKYVVVGYEAFFWDGDFHILQLTEVLTYRPSSVKVNNHGTVMIVLNYQTYLWDIYEGIKSIDNFSGIALNDSRTLVGYSTFVYKNLDIGNFSAIWKDGRIISLAELLNVKDIYKMAPQYGADYAIESLRDQIFDINNKDQIPCMGLIWGDTYPCLIEPAKKIEVNLSAYLNETPTSDSVLHHAARLCHIEILQDVIDLGFNCNERNASGQTPLYLVAEFSRDSKNEFEKKSP